MLLSCLDNLGAGRHSEGVVLNPSSPLPLYQQLAERLRDEIGRGTWAVGARIPSETDLAEQFGVGRPTVRQALEVLVRAGQLERRRGSGTFVTEPPRAIDLFSLGGTSAAFLEQGLEPEITMLEPVRRARVEADDHPHAGREAYRFSRRIAVCRGPVLVEQVSLDAAVFPSFERFAFSGHSLSRWVREEYFLEPHTAYQTFRIARLAADVAAQLDLPDDAPALAVHRRLSFPQAPDAIVVEMYCRTDVYVFSQTLGARPS